MKIWKEKTLISYAYFLEKKKVLYQFEFDTTM